MRMPRWIFLFACSAVLLGLAGCAENGMVRLPSGPGGSSYRVDLPERWNGRVVVVYTDETSSAGSCAISRKLSVMGRNLVAAGYAVAEVDSSPSGPRSNPTGGGRLGIHFVLSPGRPEGAYLVGISLGPEIALVTILIEEGRLDGRPDLVSRGFVRPDSADISAETVEQNLSRDEHSAVVLAGRLQTERVDLARELAFFYTLLSDLHRDGSAEPRIPDARRIDATATILRRLLGSVS